MACEFRFKPASQPVGRPPQLATAAAGRFAYCTGAAPNPGCGFLVASAVAFSGWRAMAVWETTSCYVALALVPESAVAGPPFAGSRQGGGSYCCSGTIEKTM